jgi:hypothetical protein
VYTFTHCSNSLTPAAVLPEPEPPNCASYDIDVLRNNEDWKGAAVGPRYRAFMQRRADAPPSLFDGASCKDYAYFVHALFVNCAQSRGARLRLVQHVLRTSFNCTCKSWIELSALERDLLYDKAIDGLREVLHFRDESVRELTEAIEKSNDAAAIATWQQDLNWLLDPDFSEEELSDISSSSSSSSSDSSDDASPVHPIPPPPRPRRTPRMQCSGSSSTKPASRSSSSSSPSPPSRRAASAGGGGGAGECTLTGKRSLSHLAQENVLRLLLPRSLPTTLQRPRT